MNSCLWKLYIAGCPLRQCTVSNGVMGGLLSLLLFACEVQHMGSCNQGSQGWNPCPLEWEYRVLTTGLPGKSPWGAF